MHSATKLPLFLLVAVLDDAVSPAAAFSGSISIAGSGSRVGESGSRQCSFQSFMSGSDDEGLESSETPSEVNEPLAKAVVKMDDGGSDLTDRFKYKVNALMGKFDPPPGQDDDERQDGNILNAMLKFPVRYTFNLVGKAGEDNGDAYVENVKKTILDTCGDETGLTCQVTPRGKKFVKLQCEVEVQSATMINTIYDEVGVLDGTVMKF